MSSADNQLYEFGEFRLDAAARLLTRQGQTVALTPKAIDLLLALVQRPGDLLDKDTLLATVWPGTFVEENNLADNVSKLRRALGDGFIETAPKRGYRFIAEVRTPQPGPPPTPAAPPRASRFGWIAAGATLAAILLFIAITRRPSPEPRPALTSSLLPPANASFGYAALSPDGRWLAFTATSNARPGLWLRSTAEDEAKPLEATDDASYPFWSPDSRSLAFFAAGKLKRIDIAGGQPTNLCNANAGTGGTWNRQGDILFTMLGESRIWRVPSTGGTPTEVLRAAPGQTDISEPSFLPDGQHFFYLALTGGDTKLAGVHVASLAGGQPRRLIEHDSNAQFVPADPQDPADGHLLFGREGALMAQPFNASTRQLTGSATIVAPRLGTIYGNNVSYRRRNFTASATGLLVYDPNPDRQRAQFLWVDRQGKTLSALATLTDISVPFLSPDESRIAVARKDLATNNNDIWLAPANGDSAVRFTFHPASDILGIWSPDGRRLAWASTRNGPFDLYEKDVDSKGQDTLLLHSGLHKFPLDYSSDGRYLLFRQIDPRTRHDIHVLPLTGERKPFPYLQTEAMENGGALSPDSRWIAYASDESGRFEVYVESFPTHGGRRQISVSGGTAPRWRADGSELYFHSGGQLMAVPVTSKFNLETGPIAPLFPFRPIGTPTIASYAPTRDGQRFLLSAIVDTETRAPLTLVQNWAQRSTPRLAP